MYRTFDTHLVREEKMLDGMWDFLMDGIDKKYSFNFRKILTFSKIKIFLNELT